MVWEAELTRIGESELVLAHDWEHDCGGIRGGDE